MILYHFTSRHLLRDQGTILAEGTKPSHVRPWGRVETPQTACVCLDAVGTGSPSGKVYGGPTLRESPSIFQPATPASSATRIGRNTTFPVIMRAPHMVPVAYRRTMPSVYLFHGSISLQRHVGEHLLIFLAFCAQSLFRRHNRSKERELDGRLLPAKLLCDFFPIV
jgi:hypothetical protein